MNVKSVTGKKWLIKECDNNQILKLCENFSISEILSRLLVIKKIKDEEINLFLNPKIKDYLRNPEILEDMRKAVDRVIKCIVEKKKIGIFGDYDVDGATSTALLNRYFSKINQLFFYYIPNRQKDGYGPSISTFKKFLNEKVNLIITVDCGTTSYEAIDYANKNSTDVIVLDHHQANIKLPKAFSIINPNRIDDKSNLNYLCAAGVTFFFLVSLNKKLREINFFKKNNIEIPDLLTMLDLVSLGTVCDVVPLKGVNRAFVKQGLKVLKKRRNLGLKTLYDLCKIEGSPNTYHLGYVIGPRINAGGRVGESSFGTKLLTSSEKEEALKIAIKLNDFNQERKNIEEKILQDIEKKIHNFINDPVLFIDGNWHDGIIGIAASRIKDKFNKPTIIVSYQNELAKASARSIANFDIGLTILLAKEKGIIKNGGGHKMAGGFSYEKSKTNELRIFFNKEFLKKGIILSNSDKYLIDSKISATAINLDVYDEIEKLSPFGSANSEPKFLVENVRIIKSKVVGKKHISSILASKSNKSFKTIAFNSVKSPLEPYLSINNKKNFNIVGKLTCNEWQGRKDIQFIIEDISAIKTTVVNNNG